MFHLASHCTTEFILCMSSLNTMMFPLFFPPTRSSRHLTLFKHGPTAEVSKTCRIQQKDRRKADRHTSRRRTQPTSSKQNTTMVIYQHSTHTVLGTPNSILCHLTTTHLHLHNRKPLYYLSTTHHHHHQQRYSLHPTPQN
jgi:hypothetical protein